MMSKSHSCKNHVDRHTQKREAWGKLCSHSSPGTGTESRLWPTISKMLNTMQKWNRDPLMILWESGITPQTLASGTGSSFTCRLFIHVTVLQCAGSSWKPASIKINELKFSKSVNPFLWRTFSLLWNTGPNLALNSMPSVPTKSKRDVLSGGQVKCGSLLICSGRAISGHFSVDVGYFQYDAWRSRLLTGPAFAPIVHPKPTPYFAVYLINRQHSGPGAEGPDPELAHLSSVMLMWESSTSVGLCWVMPSLWVRCWILSGFTGVLGWREKNSTSCSREWGAPWRLEST